MEITMRGWIVAGVIAGFAGCTDATPVGSVLGERDLSGHIPEGTESRVSAKHHTQRFRLGETRAEVEAQITTGVDSETGAAWVRSVRFVVAANDGQQIHPPGISGPLNLGTTEKPLASYAFQISHVKEHVGSTRSGTTAGRFGGDGSFAIDGEMPTGP
jgi:hypothetical protein